MLQCGQGPRNHSVKVKDKKSLRCTEITDPHPGEQCGTWANNHYEPAAVS